MHPFCSLSGSFWKLQALSWGICILAFVPGAAQALDGVPLARCEAQRWRADADGAGTDPGRLLDPAPPGAASTWLRKPLWIFARQDGSVVLSIEERPGAFRRIADFLPGSLRLDTADRWVSFQRVASGGGDWNNQVELSEWLIQAPAFPHYFHLAHANRRASYLAISWNEGWGIYRDHSMDLRHLPAVGRIVRNFALQFGRCRRVGPSEFQE
jgi:hypothetical protein